MSQMDIDVLLQGLKDYVETANNVLERKEYLELNELEEKVSVLCGHVNNMPVADAMHYAPMIEALVGELDVLQIRMVGHQKEIRDQLSGLTVNRQASQAYVRSDTMPATGISARDDD